jgi:N-acylglucosamine 2-epimerase
MNALRRAELAAFYRTALLEDVVPFWERHAPDRACGGLFTCLDQRGDVYATDKPVWIMGRAAWMFATLYREVERRPAWLEVARLACSFLTDHCFDPAGKMYFLVTREGEPLRMRRYYFSEVFAVMAYAAMARATGDDAHRAKAVDIWQRLHAALRTPGAIEPKINPHTRPMKSLSPLMCLINVADTMVAADPAHAEDYERVIDACVEEIVRDFVDRDRRAVFENVAPDGEKLDTLEGRVLNPGHAIECAWFILAVARRRGQRSLIAPACEMLNWSFDRGWDERHGGLLYFVDVDGRPSPHLEHDMKLWWPHAEALYASLLAHEMTGDDAFERMHDRVHDWTFAHFPDREHGEWFGYLCRDGSVSTTIKGNLWKGPFHIPRALLLCWKLME